MKFDPPREKAPLQFSPFKSLTVPRPIGWLSSVSRNGVANLAPYSQWQNLTFDPPMVMFAANRYPDGRRKDTVTNAEETGWFVWNMATWDLREMVNISAMALDPGESEFDRLNVSTVHADLAPIPMVADSPFHFECRYLSAHSLPGASAVGSVDVVYAAVERIHLDENALTDDGRVDIGRVKPIARMGYSDYAVIEETFEMRIPDADETEQAGLAGEALSQKAWSSKTDPQR